MNEVIERMLELLAEELEDSLREGGALRGRHAAGPGDRPALGCLHEAIRIPIRIRHSTLPRNDPSDLGQCLR